MAMKPNFEIILFPYCLGTENIFCFVYVAFILIFFDQNKTAEENKTAALSQAFKLQFRQGKTFKAKI